jgi:hypothetical protein
VGQLVAPRERDLRIDLVRGIALLVIFVDHIPDNVVSKLMPVAFGLSDFAEVFVFAAGFAAARAYGPRFLEVGARSGLVAVAKRCWAIFRAHVMLIFALAAMVAVVSTLVPNSDYMDRFNFGPLFAETNVAMPRLALLAYMPNTMDILPLYIVLIGLFPLVWVGIVRAPWVTLAISLAIWLAASIEGVNLPGYPERYWFFNPFGWQLVFVLGALAANGWAPMRRAFAWVGALPLAVLVLLSGFIVAAPWTALPGLAEARLVSVDGYWMLQDKQNLSAARVVHFLAAATLFAHLVPREGNWTERRWARLVIACGQNSLPVFCCGCILAFLGEVLVELASGPATMQIAVSILGAVVLLAVAPTLDALKRLDVPPRRRRAMPAE